MLVNSIVTMIVLLEKIINHRNFMSFIIILYLLDSLPYLNPNTHSYRLNLINSQLSFISQIFVQSSFYNFKQMESVLSQIVNELESMLMKTKELQSKYLGQILALEKIVNQTHKTVPQIIKKQPIKNKPIEIKSQITKFSVESKVDAFLNDIELKQKLIECQQKPKLEIKPVEMVIQKKPPLPTVNRNQKTLKSNHIPTFIPPKNKNQVTGKVTQTTIKSTQKLFKPEINASRRSNSREIIKNKDSSSKTKPGPQIKIQKKQEKRQIQQNIPKIEPEKYIKQMSSKLTISSQQFKAPIQKKMDIQESKNKKLQIFNRQIEDVLEQLLSKGSKNHKQNLQKLIKECQSEQVGHKKNEQASRRALIKQINNYSLSRHRVNDQITHKLSRKKWKYHPQLFEMVVKLDQLQDELSTLQNLKEYRLDPKQEYRIVQTYKKLAQIHSIIEENLPNVPDKLDIQYDHANLATNQTQNEQDGINQLNQIALNENYLKLLTEIGQLGTLSKNQLKGLQVLIEVGILQSQRSPILIKKQQYQQWKDYYFN